MSTRGGFTGKKLVMTFYDFFCFFSTFMAPAGWDKAFLVFPDLEKLAMAY